MITWEAKKEQIFEMPTGGAAIMNEGPNLLKLARKEQCLALLSVLRSKFKTNGAIYRHAPPFSRSLKGTGNCVQDRTKSSSLSGALNRLQGVPQR